MLATPTIPTLANPPRNGGSPLYAGIPRPELRQGLRAYRYAPSPEELVASTSPGGCDLSPALIQRTKPAKPYKPIFPFRQTFYP